MTTESSTLSTARLRLIECLVLLVIIGPHWLVTRDLFDGAVTTFARLIDNPDGLYVWFLNSNWVIGVLFYKICFALADLLGVGYLPVVKLFLSALLVGLYLEFASLARRLFDLSHADSRLVGLLCLASPALYTQVNSTAVTYLVCIWFMFLGHRLFWSDRLWVRLVGLAALTVSFQLNSNLVFAPALDVLHIARLRTQWRSRLAWFALLMLAAVAVYATMRLLAPPRQIFVEYNVLLNPLRAEDLRRMVRSVLMFLTWGAIPLVGLLLVALAMRLRPARAGALGGHADDRMPWFGLAGAAFLCAAAAFPYVMVGKGPPIFTVIGLGNSVTEQVLASAHAGPLAPTWANTSGRHGFLYAVPVALLTWFAARVLMARLAGPGRAALSGVAVFAALLPVFLFWVIPAYHNKLETQYIELSLVKGLKAVPAPPAGIVSLHYEPATDWAIWSVNANLMMRQAWGRGDHFGMFHAVEAYREDMLWQYHAYVRGPGGLRSSTLQHTSAMDGFPGEDCVTRYDARLPVPGVLDVWTAGLAPDGVPAAQVKMLDSKCVPGNVLPNPTPDKKIIP